MIALLLLACAGSPSKTGDSAPALDTQPQGQLMERVTWRVAVDLEGVARSEEGAAQLSGPEGVEIELGAAWVSVYVLVLEVCEPVAMGPAGARPAPLLSPLWWPVPREALAHGLPDHPSALTRPVAVDLLEEGALDLESLTFEAEAICEVGVALLRADGSSLGLPEDGALDDLTLSVEGRWRQGGEWQGFALASALPMERDLPFTGEGEALTLTLRVAEIFAEVDLSGDQDRAALDALTGLADGLSAEWSSGI